ncbi:DUF1330 domain-containing protein [uncultured Tateyamaria sp.]|uniref:DUF1330 domain-containing protein n=1 Tax=uncultured Tateyamaria sp. TaxID=455651 RepID=UPI002610F574|nr:DUF1330 domain-containing protein [uncultured Tateyamaria sp.]
MQIPNRDWMDGYFAKIPAVVEDHKGQFLAKGGDPEGLEGTKPLPDVAFILEVPDRADARSVWNSKDFQERTKVRQSGSTFNAVLLDRLK